MKLSLPRVTLRCLIVVFSLTFAVITFPPVFWLCWGGYNAMFGTAKVEAYPWAESTQDAFQACVAVSATMFQTALFVMAAIWGAVFVKKEEATVLLKHWPERLMLLIATLTLVSSAISHIVFVREMSFIAMAAAETEKVPDLTHRDVAYAFLSQCIALLGGALIAALTVISATWLNKGKGGAK